MRRLWIAWVFGIMSLCATWANAGGTVAGGVTGGHIDVMAGGVIAGYGMLTSPDGHGRNSRTSCPR